MDVQKNLDWLKRLCEQVDNSPNRLVELNSLSRTYPAFSSYYRKVHKMLTMTPEDWAQRSGMLSEVDGMRLAEERATAQVDRVDMLAQKVDEMSAKFERALAVWESMQPVTEEGTEDAEPETAPKRKRKAKATEPAEPAAETDAEGDADDSAESDDS